MTETALLGVALPTADVDGVRTTARALDSTAAHLAGLSRRGASALDGPWHGEAAVAAALRVARLSSRLAAESRRCARAAGALWVFATRLDCALDRAAAAWRLVDAAFVAQRRADVADPGLVLTGASLWTGSRGTAVFTDTDAVALSERARATAWDAHAVAERASAELVAALSELTGLSFERKHVSPRLLLDLAGFVPVVGDVVDAANGAAYLLQGERLQAGLSLGAVVPGPLGWASTSGRVGKALTDDEVVEIVRRAADPLQARHVDAAFAALYRDRERLIDKAVASADQDVRPFRTDYAQLERKWKHAPELFDLPPNGNPRLWPQLNEHLQQFVTSPTTVRFNGTHRGETASLYVDVIDMKRAVVVRSTGDFWSAWVLSPTQARHVWERHALR